MEGEDSARTVLIAKRAVFQNPCEKPCEEVSLYDDNISHRPEVSKGQISTLSVRFTLAVVQNALRVIAMDDVIFPRVGCKWADAGKTSRFPEGFYLLLDLLWIGDC